MKTIFVLTILQFFFLVSYTQPPGVNDTLVGLVVNVNGKGIKKVPVFAKGNEKEIRTDRHGIFMVVAESLPDSITVMLPSKRLFQIPVNGMKFLKIKTNESSFSVSEAKDEIIQIGYGSQRKSNSSSSTFTLTGEELLASGESDIIRAIAGKVPGVNLNYKDDGTVAIQIRGGTSFSDENEPLYVVDGSIVDNLQYVNLNDIEKVDVLKDASIYGTRGANGAIIVTTKK